MKKALRETQGRAKNVRPTADPFPGAQEMVTTFTYRPSLVKIDARNYELSW